MRNFFKIFFASLLALVVFTLLAVFFLVGFLGGIADKEKPKVDAKSVIVLDLGQAFPEQMKENPLSFISGEARDIPGLYDVIRLVDRAKSDKNVAGIYIIANSNPNGFAASEEIRHSLKDFKTSGKFILAYGDVITQKAYSIANVADSVYVSPQGYLEWAGFSVEYAFLKGTLENCKLNRKYFMPVNLKAPRNL
jgi:protease-4